MKRAGPLPEGAVLGSEPLPEEPEEAIEGVKEMWDFLVADLSMDEAELTRLDDGDPAALEDYMLTTYGLTRNLWEECAIAYREDRDMEPFEIAVVYETAETSGGGLDGLATMLRSSQTASSLSTPGPEMDLDWPDRIVFVPPNEDDMSLYDTSAIRAAWEEGDPAGLTRYDRDIYDQAEKVLAKVLRDGMSDYEKGVAIYSWAVQDVDYDWTHQDIMTVTPRESFGPYGGLMGHRAVCLGYTATFQLLCDLAGVECITVVGAAFRSTGDHGWNMVRLGGEWYCVDVTWDADQREQLGRGQEEDWDYFNVTSDYMADTDHQWDHAAAPEATAEDHGRG